MSGSESTSIQLADGCDDDPSIKQYSTREVLRHYQTGDLEKEDDIDVTFHYSHHTYKAQYIMSPWYIGEHRGLRFYLDLTCVEQWPKQPYRAEESEGEAWIFRDYRGVTPTDATERPPELMKWGFGIGDLVHREQGCEEDPPEADTSYLQPSGFNVLIDSLTRNLWITPHPDIEQDLLFDSEYQVPDLKLGWGRPIPRRALSYDEVLTGSMRITEDGWESAKLEDLRHYVTFTKFPVHRCVLQADGYAKWAEYKQAFIEQRASRGE